MPKNSVSEWDTTAANNTDVGGVDLNENTMRPRDVNNAIRTMMAQVASGILAWPTTTIELGHATDTTLSRGAAGFVAVEGKRVPSPASQAPGDILYRGSTEWERLAKGSALQVLRQNSALTAPEWATAREVLTANRTYYVRTDGSDSNTGLVNSSGGAYLTITKAWNTILSLDLNGNTATIQVGSGTFTAGLSATTAPVGGSVTLSGNGSANTTINVTSGHAVTVSCPTSLTVTAIKLQTTTSGIAALSSGGGSRITLGSDVILAGVTAHLWSQDNGYVNVSAALTVASSSTYMFFVQSGGIIAATSVTITVSGTPAWGSSGIRFDTSGAVLLASVTFSGSATGKRYDGTLVAVLQSFGAGTASTYFPGNTNGTTASGAQQA